MERIFFNKSIWLLFSINLLVVPLTLAQQNPEAREEKFILHKFQKPVGEENYAVKKIADSIKLTVDFKFNDRGTDVPLKATLVMDSAFSPGYFRMKGKTSRFSSVDVEVMQKNGKLISRLNKDVDTLDLPQSPSFFISGYSPVSVHMMLLHYWKKRSGTASIRAFPKGNINIRFAGYDTIKHEGSLQILERYTLKGLIWGSEMMWSTTSGELICLLTNDAEGDKFEAIRDTHVQHLPFFIGKSGVYGISAFRVRKYDQTSSDVVLRNAEIVDVIKGRIISRGTVVVRDGKIVKVASSNSYTPPKGVRVVDVRGKYIVPGLWDMHAHFQQVEWGPAYLAAGVTTVRDVGNEFDFINAIQKAIDNGTGIGPRILKAGIIDGEGKNALGIIRAETAAEAKAAVLKYKNAGFHQIKVYSSVKPEILKAICEEAHRHGFSVTGHVPSNVTVAEAIDLGQDQINHVHFISRYLQKTVKDKDNLFSDSVTTGLINKMKTRNIVVDPTLGIIEWISRSLDTPIDSFEPGIRFLPDDLKDIFKTMGLPAAEAAERQKMLESGKQLIYHLHKNGITIVAGTDMMVPGFSLFRELELYNQAGLTPLEALRTATIIPARVMKREHESGSIEAGKNADLIIVEGNPLANISNLRNVRLVIKGGKLYDPSELRQTIDFKP
jgi:imidazolonepropionase-like amidohydrolase